MGIADMKANEAKEITKRAQEEVSITFIMSKIKMAAQDGKYTHTFSAKDVGVLQIRRLETLGYLVKYNSDQRDFDGDFVTVTWA